MTPEETCCREAGVPLECVGSCNDDIDAIPAMAKGSLCEPWIKQMVKCSSNQSGNNLESP